MILPKRTSVEAKYIEYFLWEFLHYTFTFFTLIVSVRRKSPISYIGCVCHHLWCDKVRVPQKERKSFGILFRHLFGLPLFFFPSHCSFCSFYWRREEKEIFNNWERVFKVLTFFHKKQPGREKENFGTVNIN